MTFRSRFTPFDKAQGRLLASRFTLLAAAALCLGWMNPTRDRITEANRLFQQGKYDDAIAKYGEVLVNDPDSPLLNFNMGDANYKAGKYTEAINSFARVRAGDNDPKRTAKIAYNVGNAQYRLGAAAEADKPQDALQAYAGALVAYRRALGADATDQDAKFNYEFVSKKLDELKKKLEEQKQQQDQQQQDQQPDQKKDEQDQPEQKQPEKDQQDQQQQAQKDQDGEKQQEQQQQAAQQEGEKKDAEEQQRAAQAAGAASGDKKDQMSQQEAAALIDTAKNDELQPDEFARQVQGGVVAEPAQDW
jgi:Ca-activated chloride channel family protein